MTIKDFKLKARLVTFAAGMSVAGMAQSLLNRPSSSSPQPSKGSRPPGGLDGMPPDLRQRASTDKGMRPRQIVGSLARHARNGIDVGFHSLAALKYQKPDQPGGQVGEKTNAGVAQAKQGIDADKKRLGGDKTKPMKAGAAGKESLAEAFDRSIAEILDSTAASNGLAKKYKRERLIPAFETAFRGLRTVRGLLDKLAQHAPAREFPTAMSTNAWVADQRSRLVDAGVIEPSPEDAVPKPRPGGRKSSFDDEKPGSEFGSSMSSTVLTPPSSSSGMSVNGARSSSSSNVVAPVPPKSPRKAEEGSDEDVLLGQHEAMHRAFDTVEPQLPTKTRR